MKIRELAWSPQQIKDHAVACGGWGVGGRRCLSEKCAKKVHPTYKAWSQASRRGPRPITMNHDATPCHFNQLHVSMNATPFMSLLLVLCAWAVLWLQKGTPSFPAHKFNHELLNLEQTSGGNYYGINTHVYMCGHVKTTS